MSAHRRPSARPGRRAELRPIASFGPRRQGGKLDSQVDRRVGLRRVGLCSCAVQQIGHARSSRVANDCGPTLAARPWLGGEGRAIGEPRERIKLSGRGRLRRGLPSWGATGCSLWAERVGRSPSRHDRERRITLQATGLDALGGTIVEASDRG